MCQLWKLKVRLNLNQAPFTGNHGTLLSDREKCEEDIRYFEARNMHYRAEIIRQLLVEYEARVLRKLRSSVVLPTQIYCRNVEVKERVIELNYEIRRTSRSIKIARVL